jgi:hypothetical protein
MQKPVIALVTALGLLWMAVETVREFFANATIQYFADQPNRLLYVAAIAITGGLAAFGLSRLSPAGRNRIRQVAWGAAASASTALLGSMGFVLFAVSSPFERPASMGWVYLAVLCMSAVVVVCWCEFYRACKTPVSGAKGHS